MIGIIRRKALRAVKERMNARFCKHWKAFDSRLKYRLEVVKVLWQLVELKVLGNVQGPWLRDWLKRAEQHLACVFLVVSAFIRNPQHRHLRKARNRFGHDIEVFTRMQRHVHSSHASNGMTPHSTTVDDVLCFNRTGLAVLIFPSDTRNATPLFLDVGDEIPLFHQCPILTRAFGQSMRNVGRIALPVER